MDSRVLEGFSNELQKIAVKASSDLKEVEKKLRPGDILYTKPRRVDGIGRKIFYALESFFQGSPYTHVGLYTGDGKIIDAGEWKKGKSKDSTRVHKVDLPTFAKRYDFKALRVKTPSRKRREALDWAKKQIGKDFNMPGMFRLALPFKGSPKEEDRARGEAAKSFFCSELVSNAYAPHVNIGSKKKLEHVMPGDIFRSPHTKTVAKFEKKSSPTQFKRLMKPAKSVRIHKPEKLRPIHKSWKMPTGKGQSQ